MSFVAVAIGGSALVGGAVGLYSANKAADTQAAAANNALAFQKQTYADNQPRFADAKTAFSSASSAFNNAQGNATAAFKPYMDAGAGATYTLGSLMGQNGGKADYSSFYNSPDYNFAQQQGELGIERGANARGINLSGGTLKDLASFNSGLATQQYGNYFNRLMGLSQMGENAATGYAGASTNNATGLSNVAGGLGNLATGAASANNAAATSIGNTTQAVGQAQASGIVGGANAVTGSLNSGMQNSLLANYLGKSPSAYTGAGVAGGSVGGSTGSIGIGGGYQMPTIGY
ncbi:MAG: hypothetical protein JWP25_4679 [Bradyrhizobium sp.]|nr:hypothetical protein [Bradyrhizobium sp.]